MTAQTVADLATVPGVAPRDAATGGFVFNHTMLRVKDITKSLMILSERSLHEFLASEPDIYTVDDLKVRYRYSFLFQIPT